MLVDDHALVRMAVRQALSAPDVELVAEAASAEEALVLAPQVRPDVLLVDIALPGMDGVAARARAGAAASRDAHRDARPCRARSTTCSTRCATARSAT